MVTIQDIIDYVLHTPGNTNSNVLYTLLKQFQASDNPDLSHITATADKILLGYESVDKFGDRVEGTFEETGESTCQDILETSYGTEAQEGGSK